MLPCRKFATPQGPHPLSVCATVALLLGAATAAGCDPSVTVPSNAAPDGVTYVGTLAADRLTAVADGVAAINLAISLRSSSGAPVPGVFVTIGATGSGNVLGQPAFSSDEQGRVAAVLRATTAGEKTVTATATVGGRAVTFSTGVVVTFTPAAPTTIATPTRLAFMAAPPNATAGARLAPAVRVFLQAADGSTVASATNAVTVAFAANPGSGMLAGTRTANAVAGVATFADLSVARAAAGYTLSASSAGLQSATSAPFNVAAAVAAKLAFVEPPMDSEAGSFITPDVTVEARDAFDNVATSFAGEVVVALGQNPAAGVLLGTLTQPASRGVAVFSDLALEKAGVGYTLVASAASLATATSVPFTIYPSELDRFTLTGLPAAVTAGQTLTLVVAPRDQYNNVLASYVGTVRFRSPDLAAVLPLDYTFTAADLGSHTFAGVSLRTAGAQSLTVTDTVASAVVVSASTTVSAGPSARLTFIVQPAGGTVRAALSPAVRVAVTDSFGNRVFTASPSVALGLTPVGGVLGGSTGLFASAGLATFDALTIANEGANLRLTASSPNLASATSAAFTITDNLAPAAPSDLTATTLDRFSVGLDWFAPGDDGLFGALAPVGGFTPPGFYRVCVARQGSQTQTCAQSGQGGLPPPSEPGQIEGFDVVNLAAGSAYTFRLTAIDGAGNVSPVALATATTDPCPTGYAGDACTQCASGYHRDGSNVCVDACTSPNPCSVPPSSTCATGTTLTSYASPGTCSLTAPGEFACGYTPSTVSCAANGKVCLNNACVEQPPVLELSALAASVTAGESNTVTLTVRDPRSNLVFTGYRGTVRFSSNDSQAVLPANYTFTVADGGVHTFSGAAGMVWKTAGSGKSVTLTDSIYATSTVTAGVVVLPAAAVALAFGVQPAAVNVRTSFGSAVTLTLRDAFGNLASNAAEQSISLAPGNNPKGANLHGALTQPTVAGVAAFPGLQLDNEGVGMTLVASAEGFPALASAPFTVTDNLAPAAPASFTATVTGRFGASLDWRAPGDDGNLGDPTTQSVYLLCYTRAGAANTPVCAHSGQGGVPTPQYQDTPEGVLLEGLAAGTAYTFTLRMTDPAGNVSAAATAVATTDACDPGYSGDTCEQCALGYHRGVANLCVDACTEPNPCSTPPASTCASATTLTVSVSPGTCQVTSPGQASCNYASSPVNCATNAQICFQGACIDPPPVLVLAGVPATVAAGDALTLTLTAKNPQTQQTLVGYRGTVRFTSSDGQALLPGDYTFTEVDGGVHVFAGVVLRSPGSGRTVTVTDTVAGASTFTATATVTPGAVTSVVFTTQPASTAVRTVLGPVTGVVVTLRDALGNLATNATGNVTLSLGNNPKAAVLGGTQSVAPSGGVATFSDLSLDNEGLGITLLASYAALTPVTSAAFTITDLVAPAMPDSFSVLTFGRDTVALDWFAPGDDGLLGTLANGGKYRLCYTRQGSQTAVCAESGTAGVPPPSKPGDFESYDIVGLAAGSQYSLSLVAIDGAGNPSPSATLVFTTVACDGGYAGDSCELCATGYHRDGAQACVDACTAPSPCGTPPASTCAGDVATSYPPVGQCSTTPQAPFFSCNYPQTVTSCQATLKRCFTGACYPDLCLTTPCTAAAAPACASDGVSVVSTSLVCAMPSPSARTCSYPTSTTQCAPQVCSAAACATAVAPAAGELLVTEVMHTPSTSLASGTWFELKNTTGKLLNLAGLVVQNVDATEVVLSTFTVPATPPALVQPNGYFVFAASSLLSDNGIFGVGYAWGGSGFALSNAGRLRLRLGTTLIESLDYTTSYPQTAGRAMQLSSMVQKAQQREWYWCNALGTGSGTPGNPNNNDCGVAVSAPVDYCAVQFPKTLPSAFSGIPNTIYARVYDPNVTTRNQSGNDSYPFLVGEVGFGTSSDPATWTWAHATYNTGYGPSSPGFAGNDDELQGSITFPTTGTYKYGFRMRLDDPLTGATGAYVYCDQAGVVSGPLSNGNWGVASATIPPPVIASADYPVAPRGATLKLTGQFFTGATAVTIGGTAQAGYVVDSATQLTIPAVAATTPTGAQSIVVSVGGVNSNSNHTVDVRTFSADIPAVTMPTGVAPAFAHGGRLQVTSTGLTGATAVSIGGTAQTFTVSSDTTLTVTNLADATPLDVQGLSITTTAGATAPMPVTVMHLVISEVDSDQTLTDTAEFIEVSTGLSRAVSLNGYLLVLYNGGGSDPAAGETYTAPLIDLGKNGGVALTTRATGLLVAGNANVANNDIAVFSASGGSVSLQNGPDAIALHQGPLSGITANMTATQAKASANLALIDALLYDVVNAPTTPLPVPARAMSTLANVLLGDGSTCAPTARCAVVNEGARTTAVTDSIQRCGTERLDSRSFSRIAAPTPGVANPCP